jgi:AcrR family transcriptional regulator
MTRPPTPTGGLRERKKQQTREDLSWAALRLAVDKGFDQVLVEDIAAEVGVSSRTFNNYFGSKAEAIAWRHLQRARRVAVLIGSRPPDEPLWESITAAAMSQAGDGGSPEAEWTAGVQLMIQSPELQGEFLKASAMAEREAAIAIAKRTGTDANRDLYPRLVAAAMGVAIQVATEHWLHADPPVPLAPLLLDALTQVAAGLPPPRPA